jgi:hypothetical protein
MTAGERRYPLPMGFLETRRSNLSPYIDPHSLSRVGKRYTGEVSVLRLLCEDMLDNNSPTPQTHAFFKKIIDLGTDPSIRTTGQSNRETMFSPKGYTSTIAKRMEIDEQLIRRLIRSLRATAVYEASQNPEAEFNQKLYPAIVSLYEADQLLPPSQQDDGQLHDLVSRWDRSIAGYYKLMGEKIQEKVNGMWLGRFLPYEMDFFKDLLNYLMENNNQASFFTKKLLQDIVQFIHPNDKIIKRVSKDTHVPIDHSVIDDYIFILSEDFLPV